MSCKKYLDDVKDGNLRGLQNFLDGCCQNESMPKGLDLLLPVLTGLDGEHDSNVIEALEDFVHYWARNMTENKIELFYQFADLYVDRTETDFKKAGKAFENLHINVAENSGCVIPSKYNVDEFYLFAAENYLQEGEFRADDCLKRIRNRITRKDKLLFIRYKFCSSELQNLQRNYGGASYCYLSTLRDADALAVELNPESQNVSLNNAAVCAILDKHGPPREAILKEIQAHPLSQEIPVSNILNKVCNKQLCTPKDRKQFETDLAPQHLAIGADGRTFVENAFIRHNVSVVSSVYKNVSLKTMAHILGVEDEIAAQEVITEMITKQGLKAIIDGVGMTVEFNPEESILCTWEDQIMEFCTELEVLSSDIQRAKERSTNMTN